MSDITFTIDYTGTPNRDDSDAAVYVIDRANDDLLSADPNATLWPKSTNAEIKASYLSILLTTVTRAHDSYIQQAAENKLNEQNVRDLWDDATDAQRASAITALGG